MEFSEKDYSIPFFLENNFVRKKCKICNNFFWTQDCDVEICGEAPCQSYTFLGNPPSKKRFTLEEMREAFLSFFEINKHVRIKPYPVIARWREDLFVTIASIADFQPLVTEGIIPPPANPLVVSQPCLRFNDIDNVGLTAGRHFTIFEMGGAHAFNYPNKQIYWKDGTVRFHHEFVTNVLGVHSELVTYKEGVWSGGGNAGPDLEGIICGIEVSTLVFMQYKIVNNQFIDMPLKIVDTGYGIERFTWLTQGTPSGFHAVYGSILNKIMDMAGLAKIDEKILIESAKNSSLMNIESGSDRMVLRKKVADRLNMNSEELDRIMVPIESAFGVADHTKALVFMLSEGVVPSNVKVGYLTRLLIRRTFRLLRFLNIEDRFIDIVNMQIEKNSEDFPQIKDMKEEILEALSVEERKFRNTLSRGVELSNKIAKELKTEGKAVIPVEVLLNLYDSHGVPPEIVQEAVKKESMNITIPENFYSMVAQRHISPPLSKREDIPNILEKEASFFPETRMLYYEDAYLVTFKARVIKTIGGKYVVLDKTGFYPESGGQDSDTGILSSGDKQAKVTEVQRIGNVIIHTIEGNFLNDGEEVTGILDWNRRLNLMRHHTSTHIIMGAARRVLGEHAWQAGAQKEIDKSRLDISHWERITNEQLIEIERLANSLVMDNVPVEITWMPREKAEKAYGFRLYQGGVVPGDKIRVVKISNWDVEACGGTHLRRTGEIGIIKIFHTERIQDGVERIVFASGLPALKQIQGMEQSLRRISQIIEVPSENIVQSIEDVVRESKESRREVDRLMDHLAEIESAHMLQQSKEIQGIMLITRVTEDTEVDFLIKIAHLITEKNKKAVIAICSVNKTVKIVIMAGKEAVRLNVDAGKIASEVAKIVGGGGSGRPDFGQGGGVKINLASKALGAVEEVVKKQVSGAGI